MSDRELVSAYGLGAEALKTMANLARQVQKQGGEEKDVRLLSSDEAMLERVAQVLARAGRLRRPFSVCPAGFESRVEIFLNGFEGSPFSKIDFIVESWNCRLATEDELRAWWLADPGFLRDEDDLIIIGERDGRGNDFWTLTKSGLKTKYLPATSLIQTHHRLAMVFK